MQKTNFICCFLIGLFSYVQGQSCNSKKQIKDAIRTITDKKLSVITSEGSFEGGGFIISQYHIKDELYIYECYNNLEGVEIESYIYEKGDLISFESKKNNTKGTLQYKYIVYFIDEKMVIHKSRGDLPAEYSNEKIAKDNIIKNSARIIKEWQKSRSIK
jgi:hypothetical protein